MLDAGCQLGKFGAVSSMDLIHSDDQPVAALIQEPQELLAQCPPRNLAFGRELGGDAEAGGGDCRDSAVYRAGSELLSDSPHGFSDPAHEAGGGGLGNDGPALFPGSVVGGTQHDGLADSTGAGEDRQQSRSAGPQA